MRKRTLISLLISPLLLTTCINGVNSEVKEKERSLVSSTVASQSVIKALQEARKNDVTVTSPVKVIDSSYEGAFTFNSTVGQFQDALLKVADSYPSNRANMAAIAHLLVAAFDTGLNNRACASFRFNKEGAFVAFEFMEHGWPNQEDGTTMVKAAFDNPEDSKKFVRYLAGTPSSKK